MTDLVQRLEETASVRRNATADDKDRYLSVVARLSREDADLIEEAAAAIIALQARVEAAEAKVSHYAKLLDDQMGTPCEQIAHQEEVASLKAAVELQSAMAQACNIEVLRLKAELGALRRGLFRSWSMMT